MLGCRSDPIGGKYVLDVGVVVVIAGTFGGRYSFLFSSPGGRVGCPIVIILMIKKKN